MNAPRGGNELVAARSQIVDKSRKQHRKLSLASTLAPPSCTTLILNCGKQNSNHTRCSKGETISRSCIKLFSLTSRDSGICPFFFQFVAATVKAIFAFSLNHFPQQATRWTGLGSNEGLRGKITTNRLSHGKAPNYEDIVTVKKCYLPNTSSRRDSIRSFKQKI